MNTPSIVCAWNQTEIPGAVQSFATYLVEMRILSTNIVRDVQAPPAKTPKAIELDLSGSRSGHGCILGSTRRP